MSVSIVVPLFAEIEELVETFLSKPHSSMMVQIRYMLEPQNEAQMAHGNIATDVVDREDVLDYLNNVYQLHVSPGINPHNRVRLAPIKWILIGQYGRNRAPDYPMWRSYNPAIGQDGRLRTYAVIGSEEMVWPPAVSEWNARDCT